MHQLLHEEAPAGTPPYTLDAALQAIGFGRFQTALLFMVGLAWMADAMETLLLSFLGPAIRCDWGVTPEMESTMATVVFVGMAVGALVWGRFSDTYGRKLGISLSALLVFVAGIASALSPSYGFMLLFRFIVGFGVGGVPVSFTMFLELVPPDRRGFWSVVMQLWWTVGSVAQSLLAWAVLKPWGWRWLLALSAVPLFLLAVSFMFVPESPRYLVSVGRYEEAEATLRKFAKWNGSTLPPGRLRGVNPSAGEPTAELVSIRPVVAGSPEPATSPPPASEASPPAPTAAEVLPATAPAPRLGFRQVARILVGPRYLRSTIIMLWLTAAFCYYGLVLLSTELHVQDSGGCTGKGDVPLQSQDFKDICVTSSAEFPGMVMAALFVDKLGRRRLQALDFGVVATVLFFLLFFSSTLSHTMREVLLFIGRACMMGAFTVLYIYTAELYPTNIRSTAFGMANSFSRLGGMVAPFVGEGLVAHGENDLAIVLFAGFCAGAAILSLFLPFETSGRSLEEPASTNLTGVAVGARVVQGEDGSDACAGSPSPEGTYGTLPPATKPHAGFTQLKEDQ